jgi:hypothetical protein
VKAPHHNPAVFYYDAADGRLEAQISVTALIALAVIPLVVVGLLMWWASRDPKS